jgi:hypothetical protein
MFVARVIRITAEALFLILVVVSCGQEPPATTPGPAPTEVVPLSPTDTLPDGGGFNAPDPSSLPEGTAPAPLGLGDIGLADNATDILALFNSLPPNLMGGDRTIQSNGELGVSYGTTQPVGCGTIGLQATDVSTGDFSLMVGPPKRS